MCIPLPGRGEGAFQGPLGVALIGTLRAMAGECPTLAVSEFRLFQFGHAAMPAGVQSESGGEGDSVA
jgi:hypothetical protein